ncbi:MAG: glycosyltransferase [Paludibacteraceae bacterium]|nr:glycosyltransferase [Paludibacteraceae bacterium]
MISFIVIGKNEGWKLKLCFDSIRKVVLLDQIENYEVIYVDSRSSDDSIALAKTYPKTRVFLVTGECNAGVGRNIGAKAAVGDILFFVDGDMELQPNFIKHVLCDDEKRLIYPFISGLHLNIVYNSQWIMQYTHLQKHPKDVTEYYQQITGGLFMVERKYWEELGGIDTRLRANEDYDFGLRMSERSIKLCRKCQLLVKHHTTPYNLRSTYVTWAKYSAVVFRKHFTNMEYWKRLLIPAQYTAFTLLGCLASMIIGTIFYPSCWWLLLLVGYLLILLRKAKRQNEVKIIKMIWLVVKRDIVFLTSILCFWPKAIELKYEEK